MRTRGLPADHVGAVRVVTIEGIEDNMCCGTHVSNLSHLQVRVVMGQNAEGLWHFDRVITVIYCTRMVLCDVMLVQECFSASALVNKS